MSGAWSVGRVAGIPVRLHWSLLLLAGVGLLFSGSGALGAVTGAVLLFASIVVHEVAHALVARTYGIQTRDIVLTPIGGIARLEGMPARGRAEVAIAIAGPLASLSIAALAWGLGTFVPVGLGASLLGTLAWANGMLGLFNLIPAFPLDGGRVLRGALAESLGMRRATDLAVTVGRGAAIVMGIAGLATASVSLVLIAFFVWSASGRERDALVERDAWAREAAAWRHAVGPWRPASPEVRRVYVSF